MAPENQELPIIHYQKHKEDISLWYKEMAHFGLNQKEVKILEKHALLTYGLVATQEQLMIMVQDPEISNFTFSESDLTRKVLAKKKLDQVEKIKKMFFDKGIKVGSREPFLQYIWDFLFAPSMGYSFSVLHTVSYSVIAVQQMNLNFYYPAIFWICARLMVESGSIKSLDEDLELLSVDDDDDDEQEKQKNQTVDYFKMGSAIASLRKFNYRINLPNINESNFTFKIDEETDSILFGLKGITRIGDDLIKQIISLRPYSSLLDFKNKVKVNKIQMTMLIKAGAFDCFGDRDKLIYEYCDSEADKIKTINLTSMGRLIEGGFIPESMELYSKIFRLNKHLRKNFLFGDLIVLDAQMLEYVDFVGFNTALIKCDEGDYIFEKDWKKFYDQEMLVVKKWILPIKDELLQKVNQFAVNELVNKYGNKTYPEYEMESLTLYYTAHEMDEAKYKSWLNTLGTTPWDEISEEPVITWQGEHGGKKFQLSTIVGTAIGRDKQKFIVGLITPTGFVKLKVYRSQFVKFDKQLKREGITEKSWFSRGSKLLVSGYRDGDYFIPKAYKGDLQPIIQIEEIGKLKFRRIDEECE